MSDMTSLTIFVRKSDVRHVTAVFEGEKPDVTDMEGGIAGCHYDSVNYAGNEELQYLAAKKNVPFYGNYDSGGDYPAGVFARVDNEVHEVQCNGLMQPLAAVREDGTIDPQDLENARAYFAALAVNKTQMAAKRKK